MTVRKTIVLLCLTTAAFLLGMSWQRAHQRDLHSTIQILQQQIANAEYEKQALAAARARLDSAASETGENGAPETVTTAESTFHVPAFLQELEASFNRRDLPQAIQQMSVIASRSTTELEDLLARIENGEIKGEGSNMLREVVLRTFAQKDPEAAADYSMDRQLNNGVFTALREWGRADVDAALAWFEEKRDAGLLVGRNLKGGGNETALANLLAGVAQADMKRAIAILDKEAEGGGLDVGLRGVVLTLTDDAQRGHFLDLVEDTGNAPLQEQAVTAVALNVLTKEGFAAATTFFEDAALPPNQHDQLIRELTRSGLNDTNVTEAGARIEWALAQSSEDRQAANIRGFISKWTQLDHAAAAQWLGTIEPEATYRDGAITEFVGTVASRDPRGAFDWARVIGDEAIQLDTMGKVYRHWHNRNPAEAEKYLESEGINPADLAH